MVRFTTLEEKTNGIDDDKDDYREHPCANVDDSNDDKRLENPSFVHFGGRVGFATESWKTQEISLT